MSLQTKAKEGFWTKALPLGVMLICALVGVYGLGHQNNLLTTQADIVSLHFLGSLARGGISPYNSETVDRLSAGLPFPVEELFYPPSFLALLLPISVLDETTLRVFTVLAQIACTAWLTFYLARGNTPSASAQLLTIYNPLLYYALFQTVRFGQISCLVVALAVVFWHQRTTSKSPWWNALLLCGITMKPSIALGLLCFLLCERSFGLLVRAGLLHVLCLLTVSVVSGLNPLALVQEWFAALAAYRDHAVNSPVSPYVYGISTGLERMFGVSVALDLLVVPTAYLLWRVREVFSQSETLALLLAAAFVFGTPHAYDFYLLAPALLCLVDIPGKRGAAFAFAVLMILPQRVMVELGFVGFDSVLRVVVPMVLSAMLVSTRLFFLERSLDRRGVLSKTPWTTT
jgi:hypothetical protein